jgi:hypothetical protein
MQLTPSEKMLLLQPSPQLLSLLLEKPLIKQVALLEGDIRIPRVVGNLH